jgi:hypothetical protein
MGGRKMVTCCWGWGNRKEETRKGQLVGTRLVCDQVRNVAGVEPNLLGNTLENGVPKVNQVLGEVLVGGGEIPGDGDQSIDIVGASGCGQPIHQGLRVEEGHAEDLVGPMFSTPVVLRTKERDIPLIGPSNLVWADGKNRGVQEVLVLGFLLQRTGPLVFLKILARFWVLSVGGGAGSIYGNFFCLR